MPELISHVDRQLPHIASESLHFILEGYRATRDPCPAEQVDGARLLLERIRSLRDCLHEATGVPADALQSHEILQLDYRLAETERDLAAALHRMKPPRNRKPRAP